MIRQERWTDRASELAGLQTDRQAAVRIYKNDLIKVARWIGQGPNFRIASMCSFVP